MNENKRVVSWQVFCWAIAILLTLFIGSVTFSSRAISSVGEVKIEQAGITSDLQWIKATLIEIKLKLDGHSN